MYLTGQRKKCISFFLIGIMVFVTIAGAVLSAPVCVYALSLGGLKGTIASLIISLLLQSGVAPTNQTWINQINASYGVESSIGTIEDMISNGLLTETAEGLVDTGLSNAIQNAPAYDLIDDIFTTVATDTGVTVASGAVNLANTAINVGTVGTIGAFAGAAAIGVGVGVLVNHLREKFTDFIKAGMAIDSSSDAMQYLGVYGNSMSSAIQANNYTNYYYYDNSNIVFCSSPSSSNTRLYIAEFSGENNARIWQRKYNSYGNFYSENSFVVNKFTTLNGTDNVYNSGNIFGNPQNIINFPTKTDQDNYILQLRSGAIEPKTPISPDLIGEGGNLTFDNTTDNVPDIKNIVPPNHDMNPVDMDDYQDYVDQANDNTENGDTGQEQGQQFSDFVDPYFVDTTNQPIIPDNPDEIPTYPERPVVPEQPTIPDKTDPTSADIQQSLEGVTTIDLRSVFPFCIPWDIYSLVLIFDTGEDREAPHITFTFPFNENWVVDVDLAEYNSVAAILRLLELIVFIVGLMVATRGLIGAKG